MHPPTLRWNPGSRMACIRTYISVCEEVQICACGRLDETPDWTDALDDMGRGQGGRGMQAAVDERERKKKKAHIVR